MNRVDAYFLIHLLRGVSLMEPDENLRKMSKHPDVPCLRILATKRKRCTFHEIRRNIRRIMTRIFLKNLGGR